MQQYLNLLRHIRAVGHKKTDRTGTGTESHFGYQMRFNLADGLPLVTTKFVSFESIVIELLWFLRGDTNIKYLKENRVNIWDEWADSTGELGPIYGKQWRRWGASNGRTIDQISRIMDQIKSNPDSRRLVVSAWNVGELDEMALAPCHAMFQFYVVNGKLSCLLFQRSADVFLGVPYNIVSYSLLTHMIAQQCGLDVGEFIWTGGDCHIYLNHFEQVKLQLSRQPYPLPKLAIKRKPDSIFDYCYDDFELLNYQHHPKISAPIAV